MSEETEDAKRQVVLNLDDRMRARFKRVIARMLADQGIEVTVPQIVRTAVKQWLAKDEAKDQNGKEAR